MGEPLLRRSYMENSVLSNIRSNSEKAINEIIEISGIGKGSILVIGCSSSEMIGGKIGKNSSMDAAKALFDTVYPILSDKGIYLAVQCCEHLNRALIVEEECADRFGFEKVCVVPHPHAGGAFATTAYHNFKRPCAVEFIKADAGIDVGGTLIGMHLKHVAVPVRLSVNKIGEANILAARTRLKFIGGERAIYTVQ